MRRDQECPACGIRLMIVGEDLLTLDDARDAEMEGQLDRYRDQEWERTLEDEAPER